MPELLVATPLKRSVATQAHNFADSISIRTIAPILWDKATVKRYVSDDERQYMDDARFWLCASRHVEHILPDTGEDLYDKALYAAWALQIISPTGAKQVFLKFENAAEGFDNIGARHPKELCSTRLSRVYGAEQQGLPDQFESIYSGVKRAFSDKVVRLQNPLLLLEHGMQTGNVPLATLMFAMALDMLFMAGETNSFVSRIGGCLGLDELVFRNFSLGSSRSYQPNVKVRDVLDGVYSFRNIIAHGGEIPKTPYREPYTLVGVDGQAILTDNFSYAELLLDSALSMLTTALRTIFIEKWIDQVANKTTWKAKMTVFEHRYKDAGGSAIIKDYGR